MLKFLNDSASCFNRMVAAAWAVLLVAAALAALVLLNVDVQLFRANIYKQVLHQQGFYNQIPALVAEELAVQMSEAPCKVDPVGCDPAEAGNLPAFFYNFSQQDWETIFTELLPSDWLQEQVESVLDQMFAYLNDETSTLRLDVSVKELKTNLSSDAGINVLLQLLNSQPACTDEQLRALAQYDPFSGRPVPLICLPSASVVTQYTPQIKLVLSLAVTKLPDTVNIAGIVRRLDAPAVLQNDAGNLWSSSRQYIQQVRLAERLAVGAALVLLLLVTLFGVRSLTGWARWWGLPLLLVGVLGLVFVVSAWSGANWLFGEIASGSQVRFAGLTPGVVDLLTRIGQAAARQFLLPLLVEATAILVVGLAIFLGSFFIAPRKPAAIRLPPQDRNYGSVQY